MGLVSMISGKRILRNTSDMWWYTATNAAEEQYSNRGLKVTIN